ncbi:hypothetical protein D3C77_293230 [compost metagenome]
MLTQGLLSVLTGGVCGKDEDSTLFIYDHGQLAEPSAGAQAMFDFFRFDAKAADFHLFVQATTQLDAISGPFANIAGAVQTPMAAVSQGHLYKALITELGIVQVAQAHAGTVDVQFAGLLLSDWLQVLIEDQYLRVGDRTPQVARVVAPQENPGSRQHAGFGWAIDVVQLTLFSQLSDHRWFAHVAASDQVSQAQTLLKWQNAQQCRWQKGVADPLLANQCEQLLWIAALVLVGYHQLGATDPGWQDIQQ